MATNEEHGERRAYVSVLSSDNFADGLLVLHASLMRTCPSYGFMVLVTGKVTPTCEERLRSAGITVLRDDADVTRGLGGVLQGHRWASTFEKIKIFKMTDLDKIVYLDADMYVNGNIDNLFDMPHFAAVANREPQEWLDGRVYFNSGIMVIEPNEEEFHAITRLIPEVVGIGHTQGIAVGDQNVLNVYFRRWPDREDLHMPDEYNVFWGSVHRYVASGCYTLEPRGSGRLIRVVHFTGSTKPWTTGRILWLLRGIALPLRSGVVPRPAATRLLGKYFSLLKEVRSA